MTTISDLLEKITKVTVGILLIVLTLNVLMQVLSRQILKVPMVWTDEIARFSFIWLVFLGSSIQVKNKAHFAVTMISDNLKNKKWLNIIVYLCMLTVIIVLFIYGYKYTLMGLNKVSNALNIKMIWVYAAVPIGSLLMFIYIIELFLKELNIIKDSKSQIN
ncbi:TRAP transporter small permease [Petroclostridium sp. X23]|uniref:TRAP transporter small permease n=1 Tax=Petroclostridium sp. X23 TaxID=3045146 RepID=UPI0024ADEE92|nr:TRAP transporter small permease [Petroclostridium sp. X23]WHH59003.1 TRAP transporter small permease [Petroclostridium sp. X23]